MTSQPSNPAWTTVGANSMPNIRAAMNSPTSPGLAERPVVQAGSAIEWIRIDDEPAAGGTR